MTPIDYDLDEHHLQVSVSAGHDPSFRTGVTPIDHFDKVKEYNPQVSASARNRLVVPCWGDPNRL